MISGSKGVGSTPTIIPGFSDSVFGTRLNQGCFLISFIVIRLSGSVVNILRIKSVASSEICSGRS